MPEFIKTTVDEHKLTFPILSDADNAVAKQFGLVFGLSEELSGLYRKFDINLEKTNGNTSWELPLPARFILDQKGTIVDCEANTDYTHRPEPLKIIDILKSI